MNEVTTRARELYGKYRVGDHSYGDKRFRYDAALFKALKLLKPGQKLFDVGCGTGSYMKAFVKAGVLKTDVTGLDLAPENIEHLKAEGFSAFCADVLDLKLENAVSDFTVCQGVIHHTSSPHKAFQELVRITKPGGLIYVNVYNQWNPYYYFVHRATFPIRYIYWKWTKKIVAIIYPVILPIFQICAYLIMGEFMGKETAKTFFMDQVMTPRAYLFSKAKLAEWANECDCEVEDSNYNRYYLMLHALLQKKNNSHN